MKKVLTARFSTGYVKTRKTDKNYSHAWMVTGEWAGKRTMVSGFAGNEEFAKSAANYYAAPSACWTAPVVEIVEVCK